MLTPYVDIGATLDRACLLTGLGIVGLILFVLVVATADWYRERKK
jgi:hypothetical protein